MIEMILAKLCDDGVDFSDYPEALQSFFTYIGRSNLRERIVFADHYPASDAAILTMCAQGYGKRTAASDYKVQNRGGKGIITIKVSNRNGPVVGSLAVEPDDQIMLVTNRGKVIRTRVSEISEVGRNTQGVRVIRTHEEERVVAIERLVDQDDASAVESASPIESDPDELTEGTGAGEPGEDSASGEDGGSGGDGSDA